jgi:hypothetical protein
MKSGFFILKNRVSGNESGNTIITVYGCVRMYFATLLTNAPLLV